MQSSVAGIPLTKEERKNMTSAVKVILIPNFPAEEELHALVSLAITKPFREPKKDLLGSHSSWMAAYKEFVTSLEHKVADDDEFARYKLEEMKKSQKSNCATFKMEFKEELRTKNVFLVTIDWPGLVLMADPELAKRYGLEGGLLDCCWNCGTTKQKLAHCSRCQKARYCSPACQRDAWWHHKYTTSKKYGCV
jgi:hypothetical protein